MRSSRSPGGRSGEGEYHPAAFGSIGTVDPRGDPQARIDDEPSVDTLKTARRRIRAANWCITSYFAGVLAVATAFIPLFQVVSLVSTLLAVVCGCVGLLWLELLDRNPQRVSDVPLERVALRMRRRARKRATIGVALGLVMVLFYLW